MEDDEIMLLFTIGSHYWSYYWYSFKKMNLVILQLIVVIFLAKAIGFEEKLCNGHLKSHHAEAFNTTEIRIRQSENGYVIDLAALGRMFRCNVGESDFFVATQYNIKLVSRRITNSYSTLSVPSFYEGVCELDPGYAIKAMFYDKKLIEAVLTLYGTPDKVIIEPLSKNMDSIIFSEMADCKVDQTSLHIVYLQENYNPFFFDIELSKSKWKGAFQHARKKVATKVNITSGKDFSPQPNKSAILHPDIHTCYLHVVIDHRFFRYIAKNNLKTAVWEAVYHISEADKIFRTTDFNGDGFGDNIGFVLSNITVYETQDSDDYKLANDMNVADTLDTFSEYDFSQYCLGVLFTYQDFNDGVIGLAWAASSSYYDFPGGICQQRYTDSEGVDISLNTLLVSQLNYGDTVSRGVMSLTLAHELGHSFGAFHDEKNDKCAPGGRHGNFLMNEISVEGYKPNNRLFSECSKLVIAPVIHNKGADCFSLLNESSCGNGYLEFGEECDCGIASICDTIDPCCTPYSGNASSCTLATHLGSVCTPKMSPCCTFDCRVTPAARNEICIKERECKHGSYCNGLNATCPEAQDKENGTLCAGGTGVCQSGLCISLCELHGLVNCQCHSFEELCSVCCRSPMHLNSSNKFDCQLITKLGVLNDSFIQQYDFKLPAGSPCNNSVGYCNHHSRCVILSDQEISISSDEVFNTGEWILNYWILFILCLLVAAIIIGSIYVYLKQHGLCNLKLQADTEKLFVLVEKSKRTVNIIDLVCQELLRENF